MNIIVFLFPEQINVASSVPRRYDMNGGSQKLGGKAGFCRNRQMQTGSSETHIGWKSGKTTYFPLWDRMEGSWLYMDSEIRNIIWWARA